MKCGHKLPAETKRRILAAIRRGVRQVDVARKFDTSEKSIRRIRRRAGLPEIARRLTPEQRAGIVAGIQKGEGSVSIARRFHCDRSLVWRMGRALNGETI
jgi:transposase-like protein